MRCTVDKVGRFCWIAYLVIIFPACVICIGIVVLMLREFFVPVAGVSETAPQSLFESMVVISSVVALPIFWLLGVAIAHRFNRRWHAVIPFIAHLIPVIVLTLDFSPYPAREGNAGLESIFGYFIFAMALLLLGLASVIVAATQSSGEEGSTPNP